jgi:hypothetical protein
MHPTSSRSPRGPDGTITGYRRRSTSRTLLTALACVAALGGLAGLVVAKLPRFPSGPAAWPAGTSAPAVGSVPASRPQLGAVSWPADGVSAADISGYGVTDGPGATRRVPIASVAKLMTAYVILRDHPLPASGSGPDITVEPSEAAEYPAQVADGDSVVADAGLDPSTSSTAADQVRLGMAAMGVPALAAITAESTAVVPVAGVVRNTNALLGQDGIVGLKTGSTQAAGGCLLVAAWQRVNGHNVLIVAATFGQPGSAGTILPNALRAGRNLVLALDTALDPRLGEN